MATATNAITISAERCETLLRQLVSIRSVIGEDTTAHLWMTHRLRELGMTVEHYDVEGRRTPLVLGVLEGDGEDSFRGSAFMADLGVIDRIGTIFSAEATSCRSVEIAYPGISTWKLTAIGRTAHPTEPEHGINAITKMAKLVTAVDEGRFELPPGDSRWFKPRVTTNAIRTLPGGGWAIPARCDAVLSILSSPGSKLGEVGEALDAFLRMLEREDGEVLFERKLLPMGGGRLWLRPGECDPESAGVRAVVAAVAEVTGEQAQVKEFNGGWVDAAELMRTDERGFGHPAAITFGPGDFEQAHAVDEHIEIAEVAKAAAVYSQAARTLLCTT